MKPPMHDTVILKQPIIVDGKPVKDDQGFPQMNQIETLSNVKEESTLVTDTQGQQKQATFTVCLPPGLTPALGDEIIIQGQTVAILKRSARKSYSGKKIYYWVTNCG